MLSDKDWFDLTPELQASYRVVFDMSRKYHEVICRASYPDPAVNAFEMANFEYYNHMYTLQVYFSLLPQGLDEVFNLDEAAKFKGFTLIRETHELSEIDNLLLPDSFQRAYLKYKTFCSNIYDRQAKLREKVDAEDEEGALAEASSFVYDRNDVYSFFLINDLHHLLQIEGGSFFFRQLDGHVSIPDDIKDNIPPSLYEIIKSVRDESNHHHELKHKSTISNIELASSNILNSTNPSEVSFISASRILSVPYSEQQRAATSFPFVFDNNQADDLTSPPSPTKNVDPTPKKKSRKKKTQAVLSNQEDPGSYPSSTTTQLTKTKKRKLDLVGTVKYPKASDLHHQGPPPITHTSTLSSKKNLGASALPLRPPPNDPKFVVHMNNTKGSKFNMMNHNRIMPTAANTFKVDTMAFSSSSTAASAKHQLVMPTAAVTGAMMGYGSSSAKEAKKSSQSLKKISSPKFELRLD
jgi:hypothetical protein